MSAPVPTVPTPTFQLQGSGLTHRGWHIGPFPVTKSRNLGTNVSVDSTVSIPSVRLRPVELAVDDEDPCTTAFEVFYTQYRTAPKTDGVEWRMVFRLTSDQDGGVIGVDASLEVESNYPDIDMSLSRFTYNQPGVGRSKDNILPADYQARLTVRVWNRDAKVTLDGWMMLEVLYVQDEAAARDACAGDAPSDAWVAVGRATLFPSAAKDAPLSGRAHVPPATHRL